MQTMENRKSSDTNLSLYIYIYICMYVCMYVCIYICKTMIKLQLMIVGNYLDRKRVI